MNNFDAGIIAQLATDAGLTVGGTRLVGNQLVLIYADLKRAKPRTFETVRDTLYALMRERGVMYGISSSNIAEHEFPTLLFTQHEQAARHE